MKPAMITIDIDPDSLTDLESKVRDAIRRGIASALPDFCRDAVEDDWSDDDSNIPADIRAKAEADTPYLTEAQAIAAMERGQVVRAEGSRVRFQIRSGQMYLDVATTAPEKLGVWAKLDATNHNWREAVASNRLRIETPADRGEQDTYANGVISKDDPSILKPDPYPLTREQALNLLAEGGKVRHEGMVHHQYYKLDSLHEVALYGADGWTTGRIPVDFLTATRWQQVTDDPGTDA